MRASQKAILFLYWFGYGLLAPVLSLIFLSKGCGLQTLPLATGLYSAMVVLCEVPSGVFSDLFGRKRTFLVSCGLYLASTLLLLPARSFWMVLPAAALQGLARAFSSGSLDALFLEDAVARKGPEALSTATGQMALYQSVGLTFDALLGGALPASSAYALPLVLRMVFLAAPALLCLCTVREARAPAVRQARTRLRGHLADCGSLLRQTPALWGVLACFLSAGCLVSFLETYWQPAFLALSGDRLRPLLGMVSAVSFGAVSAGNLLTRRMRLTPGPAEWRRYFLLRGAMLCAVLFFALQLGVPGFLLGYTLIYLVMGGTDVMEQTLLNRMVPDRQRASFLSTASLSVQLGALLSSLFSAVAVSSVGFSGLFFTGAALLAAGTLAALALAKRTREPSGGGDAVS